MNIQDWFPLGWTGWMDLLAVQGTLKGLLQHHSSKASILHHSAFFMVQLSHLHMTTGKIIALTIQIFGCCLAFHSFSSKEQASFNFMAAVTICNDFGAPKSKVSHCFHCFPTYLPWSDGTRCWVLSQLFHFPILLSSRGFLVLLHWGFPDSSVGKESSCHMGDLGSIPGLGRSLGEGKGYPLQYPGLENSMDYGVTKSQIWLSNFHFHLFWLCYFLI